MTAVRYRRRLGWQRRTRRRGGARMHRRWSALARRPAAARQPRHRRSYRRRCTGRGLVAGRRRARTPGRGRHVAHPVGLRADRRRGGYVVFLLRARLVRRVALDARRMRGLRSPSRWRRWQSINVLIYWLAFVLVLAAAGTGTLMYAGSTVVSQPAVAALHRGIAWGLIGYVGLHVAGHMLMAGWRGLLTIVSPRLAHGIAAGVSLVAVGAVAAALAFVDGAMICPLVVARVTDPPRLDGDPGDAVWQMVSAVTIQTSRGANLPSGEVAVTVRAVHDGTHAYFLFEWPDATRSQKHLPLQKTASGWRVLQHGYERQDENAYYEDKFAVMLARTSHLAALRTAHLGPQPLDGLPGPSGARGLHYTTDGSIVDIWHWKSVRTGPLGADGRPLLRSAAAATGHHRRTLHRWLCAGPGAARRLPAELERFRRHAGPALLAKGPSRARTSRPHRSRSRGQRRGRMVAADEPRAAVHAGAGRACTRSARLCRASSSAVPSRAIAATSRPSAHGPRAGGGWK